MSADSNKTLNECSVDQLRDLLKLMTDDSREQESLAATANDSKTFRAHIDSLCESEDQSGSILLEMICTSGTPVTALTSIKERAKRIHGRSSTNAERNASMILYHAAIASAFGYHNQEISSHPMRKLYPVFDDLVQALGDDDLAPVFRKALARQDKAPASEHS